jgi:uncharacterized protein (DUF58 family)
MLTSRGWWLLLFVFLILAVGVLAGQQTVAVLALTVLAWVFGQWLLFTVRARFVLRAVAVEREVRDDRGPVDTLWAGRTFEVRVRVTLGHLLGLPHVAVADWLPFAVEKVEGDTARDGPLTADGPIELTYRVRCPHVGRVRFEGVRVQTADYQGLFYHVTFLARPVVLRVLPVLGGAEGPSPTTKRHNLLPPPGQHRLRRPGGSGDLLDLRDYLPGDPPKTIAWKVSARRDRLITKEFESEVPLRCTLFVDASNSVRLGPVGRNALGRLANLAAAAAQANAANRDLTGLCLFDEDGVSLLRPARRARHLVQMFRILADAAVLAPATSRAPVRDLLPVAHAFAEQVYPDLLRPEVNAVPGWLPWLWPVPSEMSRPPTVEGVVFRWTVRLIALLPFLLTAIALFRATYVVYNLDEFTPLRQDFIVPGLLVFLAQVLGLVFLYPRLLGLVRGFLEMLFDGRGRRLAGWRKQLAAIVSQRYRLGPGAVGTLLEDDAECALQLQRFLAEHDVPTPLPLYASDGRYLFAAPRKVEVLARALLTAVGKGHDNELFVLMADLLELDDQLGPLLRAVKVALARHHQVVLVCPWPVGVPLPGEEARSPLGRDGPRRPASVAALLPVLDEAATRRFHGAYQRVRQTFARLGVPVVCAAARDPVRLILDRMDRLRQLGRRR